MTNQEIYDSALRLASEVPNPDANEDYEDRAPYLIAAVCHRYAALDVLYRKAHGMDEQKILDINCFPFPTLFPLSTVFAAAVSSAVAGMLVLQENEQMSERLLKMADEMVDEIQRSLPYKKEKILSHYVF